MVVSMLKLKLIVYLLKLNKFLNKCFKFIKTNKKCYFIWYCPNIYYMLKFQWEAVKDNTFRKCLTNMKRTNGMVVRQSR